MNTKNYEQIKKIIINLRSFKDKKSILQKSYLSRELSRQISDDLNIDFYGVEDEE